MTLKKAALNFNSLCLLERLAQNHFRRNKSNMGRCIPISMAYNIVDSDKLAINNKSPLIVMHGLFGSKSNWNSLSKAIHNQTGRKVIAVDARNHGESPHTHEFSYYHIAEDINNLLRSMGLSKTSLLGHSMGGRAVMLYALTYPQDVDKLIVVDISHKSPGGEMTGMKKYFEAMRSVNLNDELSMSDGRKEANEQLSTSILDVDVRQFLLTNLVKSQNKFSWRLNIDVLERAFSSEISEFPKVSNIFNKPTLFIGGRKSSYLRVEHHEEIKEMFPNAIFQYLDAGHWVHAEKPAEFLKHVHDFLES